jgi:uncharacterized protein DUF6504
MSRVYGEPVEVQTREDGRPVRFTWRDRRYTVIAVQEHWMVNRDWWRESAPLPARPELQFWRVEASAGQGSHLPGGQSPRMGGSRPPSPLAPVPPESLPDEEARVYRTGTTGIYELRRDIAADAWTLRRIAD